MRIDPERIPRTVAAAAAEARARHGATGRVRTDTLLRAAGHDVEIKRLRAADGGLEACVIPRANGTFKFVCDAEAGPNEPDDVSMLSEPREFRISFRLAHELAHTTLDCVRFGVRRGANAASTIEARCDAFAAVFLVGAEEAQRSVLLGGDAVTALARGLNVPSSLVYMAASAA